MSRRSTWPRQLARVAPTLLTLALAAPSARANPMDMFGYGSRGPAMGNAQAATADDASANYYNPAGLVRGRELRIDLGYRFAQPVLQIDGREIGAAPSRGLEFGLVAPSHLGPVRFAFGVALFLPDQRVVRVRSGPFDPPRFIYYDNRAQRLLLSANLAVQIVPGLYVGGGLTFLSRTQGNVGFKGNIAVSKPDDSSLVSSVDVDLLAVRYPQFGLLWVPTPKLSLALTYRHSFALAVSQQLRVDGSIGNPGMPAIVDPGFLAAKSAFQDLFQPWQLTAGLAAQVTRRLMVAFDATFARWSEYPGAGVNLGIDYDLGMFNDQLKIPPARVFPAAGFHDILIAHVGAEWRALERPAWALTGRAGYTFEPTPVPRQSGEGNYVDTDKHTIAIGVGLELRRLAPLLPRPLLLDVHAALTVLPPRVTLKVDPLDWSGDYVASGAVPQLGCMLRSSF